MSPFSRQYRPRRRRFLRDLVSASWHSIVNTSSATLLNRNGYCSCASSNTLPRRRKKNFCPLHCALLWATTTCRKKPNQLTNRRNLANFYSRPSFVVLILNWHFSSILPKVAQRVFWGPKYLMFESKGYLYDLIRTKMVLWTHNSKNVYFVVLLLLKMHTLDTSHFE